MERLLHITDDNSISLGVQRHDHVGKVLLGEKEEVKVKVADEKRERGACLVFAFPQHLSLAQVINPQGFAHANQ